MSTARVIWSAKLRNTIIYVQMEQQNVGSLAKLTLIAEDKDAEQLSTGTAPAPGNRLTTFFAVVLAGQAAQIQWEAPAKQ